MSVNIGDPAFGAVEVVGETFVVETEEVENGSVEIVERLYIVGRLPAEFVGAADADTGIHTGTHEPAGEAFDVVIAPA